MPKNQSNLSLEEAKKIVKQFRLITAVAAGVLAFGTVFYHTVEKLSWIDALYFSSVSLSTVGYGDIVPKTNFGKLFTVLYLFIGIGIITALLTNIVKSAVARRTINQYEHKK